MKMLSILVLTFILCLSGCTNVKNTSENSEDLNVHKEYLTEESSVNIISVEMPVFGTDSIDRLIYEYLLGIIDEQCDFQCNTVRSDTDVANPDFNNAEYSGYFIDLDYKISYQSSELISIVFEGMLNYKKAAHPMHLLITLNIDVNNAKRVYFSDLYCIDDDLYKAFAERSVEELENLAQDEYKEDVKEFFSEFCSQESFLTGIEKESEFYCYYTENGVVISYPVLFSMGSHMETEIPYTELKKSSLNSFKTENDSGNTISTDAYIWE